MPSELASIRAEVKAWERNFKEENRREPTVDDIKKQPAVAQKYKLYKKLSKAANTPSSSSPRPNDPPSTPQRQASSASKPPNLLKSALRVAETTAPLASFNPFSPQKKDKGKQREAIPFNLFKPASNPLASPPKSKAQHPQQPPSAHPFLLIQSIPPSSSGQLPPEPPSAISRARKRLRGEPVSPSPNKEKRRRVLSPASLPFPKLQLQGSGAGSNDSDSGDDGEGFGADGGHSSFVDDSPIKPAVNGKTFTFLFQEAAKSTSITDLFGGDTPAVGPQRSSKQSSDVLSSMDSDIYSDDPKAKKTANKPSMKNRPSVKSQSSTLTKSRSKLVQTILPVMSKSSNRVRKVSPPEDRSSTKCVLPGLEPIPAYTYTDPQPTPPSDLHTSTNQLLPPSPNPNPSSRASGKSKPSDARSHQPPKASSRKKAKAKNNNSDDSIMDDMENDDGSSSSDAHKSVKLVYHSRGIRAALPTEEGMSEMEDPILNYVKRVQPRVNGSVSPVKPGGDGGAGVVLDEEDEGGDVGLVDNEKVEGHLPNELRRVLVLESLKSQKNVYEQKIIVKGLLSGRRVLHYDPRKGEIWGAGEDERDEFAEDEERGVDEGEDEWEGDPVPWEVGELSESHYHEEEM